LLYRKRRKYIILKYKHVSYFKEFRPSGEVLTAATAKRGLGASSEDATAPGGNSIYQYSSFPF
jgi:hypothetical protein